MSGHADHTPEHETPLDAWHTHSGADGVPQVESGAHANITVLLVTFVVITVATVVFAVAIGIYSLGEIDRMRGDREIAGLENAAPVAQNYKSASLASQEGYAWTAEGNVRLPIERAMDLIVEESEGTGG